VRGGDGAAAGVEGGTGMSRTTQPEPLDLPLPEPWPDPDPLCDVCAALARDRQAARAAGDFSKAADCNVEIRAHQEPHRRRR
jgi:hypothetical protein